MKSINLQVDMGHVLTQVRMQVRTQHVMQVMWQVLDHVPDPGWNKALKQVNKPLTPINFEAAYQQVSKL